MEKLDLRIFSPLINMLPEVEIPKVKPKLKKRLIWTAFALLVFAVLGISKFQKVSKSKAFIGVILPWLIIAFFVILIILLMGLAMGTV